ncbi:unnamed protein product [Adineta ricciae]|uniref:NAD(P)(+)--arginine ADP-ribosyltransferase n=1 Tax=Adineta ricciae TaxID=249248 RepID=A0A814V901_ADIRI|nr:unnamed protein product [Adineta ricciae]CAF1182217.1 unnamed protein product [Adineta ricciae]
MDIQPLERSPTNTSMATSAVSATTTDSALMAHSTVSGDTTTNTASGRATTPPNGNADRPVTPRRSSSDRPITPPRTSVDRAVTPPSATTDRPATTRSVTPKEQSTKRNPMDGYQDMPLVSLEEATEALVPLVSNLKTFVETAKKDCKKDLYGLTVDESAAIYLYTMATPFVYFINEAFQRETRAALKPWLSYLKLFVTAVEKLPSSKKTLWRGLSSTDVVSYPTEDICTWWHITSCSTNVKMTQYCVVQDVATVLAINATNAKDISKLSAFPDEEEIVLLPGTKLHIVGDPFFFQNAFSIIHLEERDEMSTQ